MQTNVPRGTISRHYYWLSWLALGFLLLSGFVYARVVRPYYGPDEPAHIYYVKSVSEGHLPAFKQDEPASRQFQQPPLYYVTAVPAYKIGGAEAVRVWSLLLCAGAVWLVFRAAVELFSAPWVGLFCALLCSLCPSFAYMAGVVNNDSLALLLYAAQLALFAKGVRSGGSTALLVKMGAIVALGLWTKETCLPLILPFLAMSWQLWRTLRFKEAHKPILVGLAIAVVLGGLWPAHNLVKYGRISIYVDQMYYDVQGTAHFPGPGADTSGLTQIPGFLDRIVGALTGSSGDLEWLSSVGELMVKETAKGFWAPLWVTSRVKSEDSGEPWLLYGSYIPSVIFCGIVAAGLWVRKSGPIGALAGVITLFLLIGIFRYAVAVDYRAIAGGRYMLPALPWLSATAGGWMSWLQGRSGRWAGIVGGGVGIVLMGYSVWFLISTIGFYLGSAYQ